MHKILFVVQDCRLEIAIFWQENRAVEGKCNGLWEISMLKRMEESQCPLRTSWSLNSKEEQSDPKKGSEPHRNDRFSWKRTDVHEGAEWEGWEKDDKEKKHFLPLGPATGTIKTRGWGGLTLEQLPRSSLADRWSWTAVLKRWLSRKKNSSGSYIPAKGVVRNTGALKVSIMARLVLFCLTGVMLATYSPC